MDNALVKNSIKGSNALRKPKQGSNLLITSYTIKVQNMLIHNACKPEAKFWFRETG